MSEPLPPWLANVDPCFVRHDWKKWLRPDWQRFMPPDPGPSIRERLWRPYREKAGAETSGASENEILALRQCLSALRLQLALVKADLRRKAGFNPEEPRDDHGRWTDAGGTQGEPPTPEPPNPPSGPLRITIYPRNVGEGGTPPTEIPPAETAPTIPSETPPTTQLRNRVVKQVARWALRTALRTASGRLGTAVLVFEAALWLHEFLPYIQAYVDPAKTLQELQQAVENGIKGYDDHHIVEQTDAERDGFPSALVHGRGNLVRVPRLKHWQITGWYMTPNKDYGGMSPRRYLRGKSWQERVRVGLKALIDAGVLKP